MRCLAREVTAPCMDFYRLVQLNVGSETKGSLGLALLEAVPENSGQKGPLGYHYFSGVSLNIFLYSLTLLSKIVLQISPCELKLFNQPLKKLSLF